MRLERSAVAVGASVPAHLMPQADPRLVYLASRVSPRTHATMREAFERIARIVGVPVERVPWAELRYEHTNAIRARLIKLYRRATVDVTLSALRGVLTTARRMGLMTFEDFARATDWDKLRGASLPAGRDLKPSEIERIGGTLAEERGAFGVFVRALFAVLLGTGARASETCGLALDAFDGHTLRVMRKGAKEAALPLDAPEAAAVERWIALRRQLGVPVPWLFIRVGRDHTPTNMGAMTVKALEHLCDDVARRAGVAHFSPHDCRRTFCTRLLDAGVDLATVQRLMGHASPDTTMRYDRRQADADAAARRKVTLWRPEWNERSESD